MNNILKKSTIKSVCGFLSVAFALAFCKFAPQKTARASTDAETISAQIDAIGEIAFGNYALKKAALDAAGNECLRHRNELGIDESSYPYHVPNYFKLLDLREKYDYYAGAAAKGLVVDVSADKTTVKTGDTVTVAIDLINTGVSARNGVAYQIGYSPFVLETQSAASGTLNFEAGEKKSVTIVFTAREGGHSFVSAAAKASGGAELAAQQVRIFVDSPGYFFADCHTHSPESDGTHSIAWNFWYAAKHGTNIMYSADHNANVVSRSSTDSSSRSLAASGYEGVLALRGSEVSAFSGHSLAYGYDANISVPMLTLSFPSYQNIINRVVTAGGAYYIAHPFDFADDGSNANNFQPLSSFDLDTIKKFTGLEILNGLSVNANNARTEKRISNSLLLWDMMNLKGEQKYFGVGNSDAHTPVHIALARSAFYMEEFTENRVNNALVSGSLYATNGPELRFEMGGARMGGTVAAGGETSVPVKIKALSAADPLTKVSLIKYTIGGSVNAGLGSKSETVLLGETPPVKTSYTYEENLTVRPNEFYRVEVTTQSAANGLKRAYSNPIWIAAPAKSLSFEQAVVYTEAGKKGVLKTVSDSLYDSVKFTSSNTAAIEVMDNGFYSVNNNAPASIVTITATAASGRKEICYVVIGDGGSDKLPSSGEPVSGGGCKSKNAAVLAVILPMLGAFFAARKKIGG